MRCFRRSLPRGLLVFRGVFIFLMELKRASPFCLETKEAKIQDGKNLLPARPAPARFSVGPLCAWIRCSKIVSNRYKTVPKLILTSIKTIVFRVKMCQKQLKIVVFWLFFYRKRLFLSLKFNKKQSNTPLFDYFKAVFEAKSVPNVPLVSPVPRYSTAKQAV